MEDVKKSKLYTPSLLETKDEVEEVIRRVCSVKLMV